MSHPNNHYWDNAVIGAKWLDKHHAAVIRGGELIADAAVTLRGRPDLIADITAGAETANAAWDRMDTVIEEGKELVDEGTEFINSDFVKNLQDQMSNKSQKLSNTSVLPGSNPRTRRNPTITTRARSSSSGRKADATFSMRSSYSTPVNASGLVSNVDYFDSHLIEGPTEKTMTKLHVKIGKQVYPDLITPFLKNLMGSGKIKMEFAGRCVSATNLRHVHMQVFRHRLSAGSDSTVAAWPEGNATTPPGTAKYILGPQNAEKFNIAGGTSLVGPYDTGTTSFRDMKPGSCYWAPYNKADLEDLSWNLNTLKMDSGKWIGTTLPVFEPNVKLFQPNAHARESQIAKNNRDTVTLPPSASTKPGTYRYKAVFNKGSIHYDFLNKGLGGAKVELIIYRKKKSAAFTYNGNSFGNSSKVLLNDISGAIGAGYMETCVGKGGTDKLLGRVPSVDDIRTNPAFPFLPVLKKTLGAQMMYVEIARQTFAMPSGSRRELNIDLPGEVYDPVDNPSTMTSNAVNLNPSIVDNGSILVVMSVSGVKSTQAISYVGTTAPTDIANEYNVGDMYAGANIQFYGQYTEHMGACQYKPNTEANIYTQGGILMPDVPSADWLATPITMLPAESAVRLGPATTSGHAGPGGSVKPSSNCLQLSFDATPVPP